MIRRKLTRRDFCQLTAACLPTMAFASNSWPKLNTPPENAHFFLNFIFSGGLDATYLFDARPLAMTDRGKIQNYLYRNAAEDIPRLDDPTPIRWQGANGNTTLVTPLVKGLQSYRESFSILNGVLMLSNNLVAHGQNMYFLFNGQSVNGDSFVPIIGKKWAKPLDSVHIGGFEGDGNRAPENFSGSAKLDSSVAGLAMAEDLRQGPILDLNRNSSKFIGERLSHYSRNHGLFAAGSRKLLAGLERAPELSERLKSVEQTISEIELENAIQVAFQYFRNGITNCITIMVDHDPDVDTHDYTEAQRQFEKYQVVATELELIFKKLTEAPFDEENGQSFLDVTTVMISSEFSRTMRQLGMSIDATGTDHNPLTNTVLLAGKGIRGGLIIGGSDLESIDEQGQYSSLSPAHQRLDPYLLSPMGKPIDFETLNLKPVLPEQFVLEEYLTFPSIVNTLFHLSGVKEDLYFRWGPGSSQNAPILKPILT